MNLETKAAWNRRADVMPLSTCLIFSSGFGSTGPDSPAYFCGLPPPPSISPAFSKPLFPHTTSLAILEFSTLNFYILYAVAS